MCEGFFVELQSVAKERIRQATVILSTVQQSQLFQAAPHRGQGLPNPRVGMLQKSTADCERAPHIAEIKKSSTSAVR